MNWALKMFASKTSQFQFIILSKICEIVQLHKERWTQMTTKQHLRMAGDRKWNSSASLDIVIWENKERLLKSERMLQVSASNQMWCLQESTGFLRALNTELKQ